MSHNPSHPVSTSAHLKREMDIAKALLEGTALPQGVESADVLRARDVSASITTPEGFAADVVVDRQTNRVVVVVKGAEGYSDELAMPMVFNGWRSEREVLVDAGGKALELAQGVSDPTRLAKKFIPGVGYVELADMARTGASLVTDLVENRDYFNGANEFADRLKSAIRSAAEKDQQYRNLVDENDAPKLTFFGEGAFGTLAMGLAEMNGGRGLGVDPLSPKGLLESSEVQRVKAANRVVENADLVALDTGLTVSDFLGGAQHDRVQHYVIPNDGGSLLSSSVVQDMPPAPTQSSPSAVTEARKARLEHISERLAADHYLRVPQESSAPVDNTFSLETATTSAVAREQALQGETAVNSDDRSLVKTGSYHLQGKGNVNTEQGLTAYANNILSDGFRPGDHNLAVETLDDQLAQSVIEPAPQSPPLDAVLERKPTPPSRGSLFLRPEPETPVVSPEELIRSASFEPSYRPFGFEEMKAAALNVVASGVRQTQPTDPLVLDLDGNGVSLTHVEEDPVLFDIDNDGQKELTGWTAGQDGLLVMDLDGNGQIDNAREVISEHFNSIPGVGVPIHKNGFEALSMFDRNKDGTFDSRDPGWDESPPADLTVYPLLRPGQVEEIFGGMEIFYEHRIKAYEAQIYTLLAQAFTDSKAMISSSLKPNGQGGYSFDTATSQAVISRIKEFNTQCAETRDAFLNEIMECNSLADFAGITTSLPIPMDYDSSRAMFLRYVLNIENNLHNFINTLKVSDTYNNELSSMLLDFFGGEAKTFSAARGLVPSGQIKVWQDLNHDGITDPGELKSLSDLNVRGISLYSQPQSGLFNSGNQVVASGSLIQSTRYEDADGSVTYYGQSRPIQAVKFAAEASGSRQRGSGQSRVTVGESGQSTYVSSSSTGEVINVAAKGVRNAHGSSHDDTLIGDGNANWLIGRGGRDTFRAGAGDDVLVIDADDRPADIDAGADFDMIIATGDRGVLLNMSEINAEVFRGSRGHDTVFAGGNTSVYLRGGDGNDTLVGGGANDALSGENGNDRLVGNGGNDVLRGHKGRDLLEGGAGDDILEGGQGDDRLFGGADNDVLIGGAGDDYLDGGAGDDVVSYSGSYANYQITRLGENAWRVVDRTGRDGADIVTNVEKLSFADIGWVSLKDAAPAPVADTINVSGRDGGRIRIDAEQLLENDRNLQGKNLQIRSVSDAKGGSVSLDAASGSVYFVPDPDFRGVMEFSYTMGDEDGNYASVQQVATGDIQRAKAKVYLRTPDLPTDDLFPHQWYLDSTKVIDAWGTAPSTQFAQSGHEYTGQGVRVGVFEVVGPYSSGDETFDTSHPDLSPNLDPLWHQNAWLDKPNMVSNHATMVAGVIAGARNGEGSIGVAYNAKISGHSLGRNWEDLFYYKHYDIVNNSWVFNNPYIIRFGKSFNPESPGQNPGSVDDGIIGTINENLYIEAAQYGRGGLGTIIVQSSGNSRAEGENANSDNAGNNRYSIQVGGINAQADLGQLETSLPPFSEPGASLLVSAPASHIKSSSHLVENGNGSTFGSDYTLTQGTSFATPIVSGIAALILEANPGLGYRDVQKILAFSARNVEDPNTDWQTNGATHWNGGGLHTSHDYGFGAVDARAAVRLAETWTTRQTFDNEESLEKASGPLNRAILDHQTLSFTTRMDRGLTVEHAEVDVTFTHERWGDLHITLISPDGTRSVLADRIGKVPGSGASDTGSDKSGTLFFRFMTTNSWGEDSGGVWRLEVKDQATGKTGTLTDWGLRLYGRKNETDDIYVYTDEYSSQSGSSRGRLADRDGGTDTINAAALSVDATINLRTGHATLGGRSLTIETPRNIENVFTGDGDDTLVGNAAANMLYAGRGTNTMTGNGGADSFMVRMRSGGHDTVTDFSSVDGDQIVLIGPDPIDFSQLTMVDQADGALVTVPFGDGEGNTIKLKGIRASSLNEDSFGFRFHINHPFDSDQPDLPRIDGDYKANKITGTDAGEIITGYARDDVIRGHGGDDTLQGGPGEGSDVLFGDADEDTLILEGGLARIFVSKLKHTGKQMNFGISFEGSFASGGTENDVFVIAKAGKHPLSNFITDFNKHGENDKIDLSHFPIFSQRDIKIEERNTPGAQLLCISFNGLNLATLLGVRKSDFDVSSIIFADPGQIMPNREEGSLDPTPPSNSWARTIGDAGANELSGRNPAGSPLKGRTGDDTYTINFSGDTVVENKDEGYDTVRSEFSYTLPEHVEKLTLTGTGAINGTGNNLANRLEGNDAANRLDGRGGSDQMVGKGGNDTYVVDSNGDRVIEQANEGTDTVEASVSFVLPEHVENLTLTGTEAINATGNRENNVLTGNTAANIMDGQRGNDILAGKEGGDLYLFDRKSGVDTIQENDATPGVTDTLQFSASIHHDQIWFERRGNDLELSVVGTTDKVIIDDWYLGQQHQVEQIVSGDGKTLTFDRVEALRAAMNPLDPAPIGQHELSASQQHALAVSLETAWL